MVVSYFTAPKRKDQVEGVHHYFITNEEMNNLLESSTILAYTKTKKGILYCGTLESFKRDTNVYIIDPAGVKC